MEGTHRLTLREPISVTQSDEGEITVASWRNHIVWANRRDQGGRTDVRSDLTDITWDVEFIFRKHSAIDSINQDWEIIDSDNRTYEIERVGLVGGTAVDQLRINRYRALCTYRRRRLEDLPLAGVSDNEFTTAFSTAFRS